MHHHMQCRMNCPTWTLRSCSKCHVSVACVYADPPHEGDRYRGRKHRVNLYGQTQDTKGEKVETATVAQSLMLAFKRVAISGATAAPYTKVGDERKKGHWHL